MEPEKQLENEKLNRLYGFTGRDDRVSLVWDAQEASPFFKLKVFQASGVVKHFDDKGILNLLGQPYFHLPAFVKNAIAKHIDSGVANFFSSIAKAVHPVQRTRGHKL